MKNIRKKLFVIISIFVVLIFCIYFLFRNKNVNVEEINSLKSIIQERHNDSKNIQNISNLNFSNNFDTRLCKDLRRTNINITLAKADIILENFVITSTFQRIVGVSRPLLPSISPDVQLSLDLLYQTKNKKLLGHIAYLFVRYAIMEIQEGHRPSALMNGRNPFVQCFTFNIKPISGDEFVFSTMIDWISENRERFSENHLLDETLVTYKLEKEKEADRQKVLLREFHENRKKQLKEK